MSKELPKHAEFLLFAETLADASRDMLIAASRDLPEVTVKADASYVTTTDRAIEKKLREMII
jgi:inositol-phosphate phosphatase/L-galactose 1-phosphate phosphatase/histidinol-phosphatase